MQWLFWPNTKKRLHINVSQTRFPVRSEVALNRYNHFDLRYAIVNALHFWGQTCDCLIYWYFPRGNLHASRSNLKLISQVHKSWARVSVGTWYIKATVYCTETASSTKKHGSNVSNLSTVLCLIFDKKEIAT